MLALIALASFLVADEPTAAPPGPPSASARAEYEQIKAAAGRSPEAQVRLAYWCEANGLSAERLRHLSQAVLADPTNAAARGLLGLVARDGRWARPEAVAAEQFADAARAALLAEYDRRRSATPYTADAQLDLGVWADDRGLKDQARAHYTAATRLDPRKDVAWKRLGYKKRDGRWQTDAQLAADKAGDAAQKDADRRWEPLLAKWRDQLTKPARRAEAEANLLAVTDPRAVPSIAQVFGRAEADQLRAVQLLGQVDSIASSRGLVTLATFAKATEARRLATETLRGRDPREYADLLIALIRDRIEYEVTPVAGPGSPGVLKVKGKKVDVNRLYTPATPFQPGDRFTYDPQLGAIVTRGFGPAFATELLPVYQEYQNILDPSRRPIDTSGVDFLAANLHGQMSKAELGKIFKEAPLGFSGIGGIDSTILLSAMTSSTPINPGTYISFAFQNQQKYSYEELAQESRRAAVAAQQQVEGDRHVLDRINAGVDEVNGRAVGILRAATGQNLPVERESWAKWWVNLVGYRYNQASAGDRLTIVEQVPVGYVPQAKAIASTFEVVGYSRVSCFGAGTPVQTIAGPRPIETLQVGDLVLTQSTATGALGYQPILVRHHTPPSTTFRIKIEGDEIVSSDFHRFWVAGRGWVMARKLKAGDRIRTLGGVVPVEAVEPGKTEPVFNLDVAEDADFFAGRSAALVHDNTLPDPRLVPFDAPAATPKAVAAR